MNAGSCMPAEAAGGSRALRGAVFFLVASGFTTLYLVQPVLPVLQAEFGVGETTASFAVSAVVLGIALANLPFGRLADRHPLHPLILAGGAVVSLGGLLCALAPRLEVLIGLRFLQGLFLPALTTCIAADLARRFPPERVNVILGAYVAATVVGGLAGRLLGGWIHPLLHWRWAFVASALLTAAATAVALRVIPREGRRPGAAGVEPGFAALLRCPALLRPVAAGFGAFFVFSALFNYLPFYLAAEPFRASTGCITGMYLVYTLGVVIAPLSGRVSNRFGNGATLAAGAALLGVSLALTLLPFYTAVVLGLSGVCLGFFSVHAAAVGALNRRLLRGRGRANALYVLGYYLGGTAGITLCGHAYQGWGWGGVCAVGAAMTSAILGIGVFELRRARAAGTNFLAEGESTPCSG